MVPMNEADLNYSHDWNVPESALVNSEWILFGILRSVRNRSPADPDANAQAQAHALVTPHHH